MNGGVQTLQRWWGERPTRERLLLLAGGTAAMLVAGDSLLNVPLERRLKQARAQLQTQQSQLETLRAAAGPGEAAQKLRDQAAQLQRRIASAQATTVALRQQAADAARLPETLRAITATVGSARLLALDFAADTSSPLSNAAAPALASNAAASAPAPLSSLASGGALAPPRLYRLPITLKVSGTFEELHMLLTQIERHAEALQWSQLTLDSSGWPAIQLTLKAHVLSPEPRWGAAS